MSDVARSVHLSHQRSIALQSFHWKLPQPAQGRHPCAEIIEDDSDSHMPQVRQHGDRKLGVGGGNALRHFELEPRRVDARPLQRILNIICQPRIRKLPRRYVDRNIYGLPGETVGLPIAQLPARLPQQPMADRHYNSIPYAPRPR